MQRILIGSVLMVLSVSMLLAVGSAAADPLVFSVLYNERSSSPFQEDWLILEEYASRRNVVLDVRLGDDANYERAIIRTFESGIIPDIVLKVWPETIESYANSGILLPFSDYEHLMPHFTAYIDEHDLDGELDKLRLENGKYYILPGYRRTAQVQQWIYRRDLFESFGLGVPDTYEELLTSLMFLKGIYPDSTPLTACWGGAHLFAMMGAGYEIPAGWAGTRYYNVEEDYWAFAPATDNYREMLIYLNRCYQTGVLDPAIFTQSDAEYYAKIQDGRALATVTWITSGFDNWNQQLHDAGIAGGEWAALPVPESTIGIRELPSVDPFRKGLVVPSRVLGEPYFEDLLRFLDWAVYSEEGMTLTTWGVEGVTFESTPEGKAFLPPIRTAVTTDGVSELPEEHGLGLMFDLNENAEFEDSKKPPEIVEFLEQSLASGDAAAVPPRLVLSSSALEAISTISVSIEAYASHANQDFITGLLSVSEDWDSYIDALRQRGYLTLEAIWNAAWDGQDAEGR